MLTYNLLRYFLDRGARGPPHPRCWKAEPVRDRRSQAGAFL